MLANRKSGLLEFQKKKKIWKKIKNSEGQYARAKEGLTEARAQSRTYSPI